LKTAELAIQIGQNASLVFQDTTLSTEDAKMNQGNLQSRSEWFPWFAL
jgi:hypothetical protein